MDTTPILFLFIYLFFFFYISNELLWYERCDNIFLRLFLGFFSGDQHRFLLHEGNEPTKVTIVILAGRKI